jgi:hypothetical protein
MKSPSPDRHLIPVPWCETEQDYLSVFAMLPASERQELISCDAFRAWIENQEKIFQDKGLITRRIPVSPAAIKAWCDANGYQVCRVSIIHFVAETLAASLE